MDLVTSADRGSEGKYYAVSRFPVTFRTLTCIDLWLSDFKCILLLECGLCCDGMLSSFHFLTTQLYLYQSKIKHQIICDNHESSLD